MLADAKVKRLLSSEHFSVDGTLIEAWASMKSFRPKDGSGEPPAPGRNSERDFHGETRSNDTHVSTTDPEARLARKSAGREGKLCFMGHALMEDRSGLIVDACLTRADGHAERVVALAMIEPRADRPGRITLGADKGWDAEDFVNEPRSMTSCRMSRPRSGAPPSTAARPTCRLPGQPDRPQTHRGGIRLGQGRGRFRSGQAPRPGPRRLAVHPRHGRLRSHPAAETPVFDLMSDRLRGGLRLHHTSLPPHACLTVRQPEDRGPPPAFSSAC